MTLAIPKQAVVARVDKLRLAARDYACVICGTFGSTVAAHCNDVSVKGIGRKAPGYLIAYLCQQCHDQCDGRSGGMDKAAKRALWNEAYWRTARIWFESQMVVVR
jgi:hypothetical protein